MPENFMTEPSKVLMQYLGLPWASTRLLQLGMLGMALEIITRIKLLEDLPVTTEVGRQEAITVLQTMLTELEISDLAYEWYERLAEWRRPQFVPMTASERLEHSLQGDVVSDAPGGPLRPARTQLDVGVSEPEAHL